MTDAPHILVCGGAGYIGSHMCKLLNRAGMVPVTLDNLSTGHRWAVKWGPFEEGDLTDRASIESVLQKYPFHAVMHFAARSLVAESQSLPSLYFQNNTVGTLRLLEAMARCDVRFLVFSSTAAVYGTPKYLPIDESHPTEPVNNYGLSKLMAEQIVHAFCSAHQIGAVIFRYFNAVGASHDKDIGEWHEPETHLVPNVIEALLGESTRPFVIFGADYPTPDGTCVRDFIHVEDLCEAHLLALQQIGSFTDFPMVFNLGTDCGYSVKEVAKACERMTGRTLSAAVASRRDGDPPQLVASSQRARSLLSWRPSRDLETSLSSAIAWHLSRPALKQHM